MEKVYSNTDADWDSATPFSINLARPDLDSLQLIAAVADVDCS